MINLNDHKAQKEAELAFKELTTIIAKLTNSIESLKDYGKHIPIMESLSILHNARTLIEIQISKIKHD